MPQSYTGAVKGPDKIVFNLKDVNKVNVFTRDVTEGTMIYQRYYKQYSLYMVEHAEHVVELHNYNLGKYPKPRPKHAIR
jgi:hypothetical protein